MKQAKAEHSLRDPERISSYFRLEALSLGIITASGILYNIGMTAGPWFEGQLAQCLYDIIGGSRVFADMLRLALAYVAVILAVQAARYIKRFYVRRFANNIGRAMKRTLYMSLVTNAKPGASGETQGSLMTKAVSDVDACVEGMRKFTTEVFDTGVVLVAYLVMLFIYDVRLALISCIFPPLAYIIAELLKNQVTNRAAECRESAGRLNASTLDIVSGALTYRVFGCGDRAAAGYGERLADYEKKSVRSNVLLGSMQPLYQIISMTGAIFIIWFGAKNVAGTGWAAWDIAAFTTFLSCFSKLALKSSKAAKLFNAVQKARVSWTRIKPLMKAVPEFTDAVPAAPEKITARDVSFAYPGCGELFSGVCFDIMPGELVGVTGPVACGKSTLGRLFTGEAGYGGSLCFGGREFSTLDGAERAGIFAYMGHDPELFNDTIAENVTLGGGKSAGEYLRAVCIDGEIAEMPDGESSVIGSGGVKLSGGQQARIALARTLCGARPLIVLDDPFSAVDAATERDISVNMRRYTENSAVLLISHRLAGFPRFDRVIWLDGGKAVVGTHEELMRAVPDYARLYLDQTGGIVTAGTDADIKAEGGNADEKQ